MKKIVTIILSVLLGLGLLAAATYVFILAPTFRHDKERLAIQKDESMMSEIENVISVKLADQEIYDALLKYMELNLTESDSVEIDILLVSKINRDETEYSLGKSIMTCSENEKIKYLKGNDTFHNAIVSVIGNKHTCVSKKYQGMDYQMSVTLDSRGMNYTEITGKFLQHDNDKINKLINLIKEESKIDNKDTDEENIYINDLADLLIDAEETKLKDWVSDEYSNLNYNVLFLTINNADGKTTMTYSDDYMDNMFTDTDENIAFVIDMDNREMYINTMGTAIQLINDSEIDTALDAGFEKIANEDYYGCFQEMSRHCLDILLENEKLEIEKLDDNDTDSETERLSGILKQPLNDYLERSYIQKDESAMAEIENAFILSFADDYMCNEFLKYQILKLNKSDKYDITIVFTPRDSAKDIYYFNNVTINCDGKTEYLDKNEVFYDKVFQHFGNSVQLSSEKYKGLNYIINIHFNKNDIGQAGKSPAQVSGCFEGFESE